MTSTTVQQSEDYGFGKFAIPLDVIRHRFEDPAFPHYKEWFASVNLDYKAVKGPISDDRNAVYWPIVVGPTSINSNRALQGGVAVKLMDSMSTFHHLAATGKKTVSININVTYHKPAPLGTRGVIATYIRRSGRTVAITEVELYDAAALESGKKVSYVSMTHVMAVVGSVLGDVAAQKLSASKL